MSTVDQAASLLLSVRRGELPRPARLPESIAPRTEAEAYAMQLAVLRAAGEHIGGYKASMPDANRGTSAPIAASAVVASPARLEGQRFGTRATQRFGIEPEIAFRMARDLPPRRRGESWSRNDIVAAIASAHAAIEICVARLESFDNAPPLHRLADAIMNEALVIGAPLIDWQSLDLSNLALRVAIDGAVVHQGIGGHPIVDPLVPLVWLVNHLSERGQTLAAGAYVTTGSCNGIRWAGPGQHVEVDFARLGRAAITF